ncbi:MAG: sulfurtransferase TusA family protein [Parabacteroides sp.]
MKHTLDITREHCPMTFVRTKLKLAQIAKGDTLEVLLTEGEPLENVPRSAREQGFQVLSVEPTETPHIYRVLIEK